MVPRGQGVPQADIEILQDMIWVETICGNRYPVRCHGREPEEVAAIASRDLQQPVKVVKQGETDAS